MTITLRLPPDVEARLRDGVARKDAEAVRRVLSEAFSESVDATVESLLQNSSSAVASRPGKLSDAEFEELADEFADSDELPTLSDWAVSREGIYQDHP